MNSTVWIALLEVEPLAGGQYEKFGNAFVNGIVAAKAEEDAISFFESHLKQIGWKLNSYEDLEKYDERIKKYKVALELQKLAKIVKKKDGVQFGTFHVWKKDLKNRHKDGKSK